MAVNPEIRIFGEKVEVRVRRKKLADTSLEQLLRALEQAGPADGDRFEIRPKNTRLWVQRGDAVALALEIAPHARTVRWLADDSKTPFGRGAEYERYFVCFPWIVVLLVFRGGALTGQQQLYYRRESLDAGDELLLPNLYNVADGYGQQCWLCLQNLPDLSAMPWHEKLARVVNHTFTAGFNKSAEEHEGNSYWSARTAVDERLASMEKWQRATREDRRFVLDVSWKPAGTSATPELRKMLDQVVRPRRLSNSAELCGLLNAAPVQQELL